MYILVAILFFISLIFSINILLPKDEIKMKAREKIENVKMKEKMVRESSPIFQKIPKELNQ